MSELTKGYLTQFIKTKASELGFFKCGISEAGFLDSDAEKLEKWLKKRFHAGMGYMEKDFEKRTNPRKLFENAKSVISVLYNYYPQTVISEENNYKISKYAYGKDYHFVLKQKLNELIKIIQGEAGDIEARAFVDSAPVLDRAWAAKSGLGWIGKNTNLITKEQGSFFYIGEIITSLELNYEDKPIPPSCGHCTKCIEACPTHALRPYEVNSNKCISYLTIENKDEQLPVNLKGKFNDWIFGCDICQDVCPWNRFAKPHNEPVFEPKEVLVNMKKTDWENLSEEKYIELFKNSPIKRVKYNGLIRNIRFVQK